MTGPITRPESIIAGRYTQDGQLVIVARSVPLSPAQSISLATVLEPAGPGHPWPDTVNSSRFGNNEDRVALTKVQPTAVHAPRRWSSGCATPRAVRTQSEPSFLGF